MRAELPLPSKPPFTTHLGNMPFDATNGDVEDFFTGCQVSSVRIVEDKMDMKPKGFAYVEFKTLEGIKKALELNGTQFMGRNIRISVAEPRKYRPIKWVLLKLMHFPAEKDRAESSRDFSDWSRKGPLPDVAGARKGPERGGFGSGAPRNFDNASDAGGERGPRRGGFEPAGDGKVRDFGNWDRKGPLTPTLPAEGRGPPRSFDRPDRPVSRDGPAGRRNSPAWGEGTGRSQDGSRPPRREFAERPPPVERAPTAAEQDSQWRTKMKPDAPPATSPQASKSPPLSNSQPSNPPSPAAAPAAPVSRPKLNLAKRTVSEAVPDAAASPAADAKASPFGAARPVDTAAKEKEVEEKRQVALREKKEAEEKARADKKAADDKAREERKPAKDAEEASKPQGEKANGQKAEKPVKGEKQDKENGASAPAPGKSYEILRRNANEEASAADEEVDAGGENANGVVTGDKETKPKEIVRDINATNGGVSAEPTAESLEEEGWSTVSKPVKGKKNINQAARAIAS